MQDARLLVTIDDTPPELQRQEVFNFLRGGGWRFGWKSSRKTDAYSFWHLHFAGHRNAGEQTPYPCADELEKNAPLIFKVWSGLADTVFRGHTLMRCYANAHAYGGDGTLHTDSIDPDSRTAVYYPHGVWWPNWGGETVVFNRRNPTSSPRCIRSRTGWWYFRGVCRTSPAACRGPARSCASSWSSKPRSAMIRDEHRIFLIERAHADAVKHSGRSFYDHLCGTHALLEQWGNCEPVCTAGLFHSLYGTNRFRHKSWPLTERATIRELIGERAEELVYLFCTSDRPRAFLRTLDTPILRALREIEAANLLEQGSQSKWLRVLAASAISNGARQAIEAKLCVT